MPPSCLKQRQAQHFCPIAQCLAPVYWIYAPGRARTHLGQKSTTPMPTDEISITTTTSMTANEVDHVPQQEEIADNDEEEDDDDNDDDDDDNDDDDTGWEFTRWHVRSSIGAEDLPERHVDRMYFELDTNVLIHNLAFVEELAKVTLPDTAGSILYIPYMVIKELDKLKDKHSNDNES